MIKITTTELLKNFDINGKKCHYKNDKPCVIDFHASWCQPCKTTHIILNELEVLNPDIIFYTVDIEEEYELAEIFSIKNLPTILLCSKKHETVRMSGSMGKNKIQDSLNKVTLNVLV
jgi:thiol-disulfide isomerase/thioredoxin